MTPPQKRGATTRASGSTAIISIADELLGRLHEADLGGDRAAGAAREQQTRDHRARARAPATAPTSTPSDSVGAVALQRVVALQRQHHADEQARHEDDDERQHAGEIDLAQREAEAAKRGRRVQRAPRTKKRAGVAQRAQIAVDRAARRAGAAPPASVEQRAARASELVGDTARAG